MSTKATQVRKPSAPLLYTTLTCKKFKKLKGQTGFVLLPKRWVAERRAGWLNCFRRLGRDYERLSSSLQQLKFVGFAYLLLARPAASA